MLAILEALEVALSISIELDIIKELRAKSSALLLKSSLSETIIEDDLLVLGAILVLVPFLNV